MSRDFSLKLSNSTFNDITDLEVVWDSKKLGVSNFECVRAGSSKEYTLIQGWSTLKTATMVTTNLVVTPAVVAVPLFFWGAYTDYKLEVTITFRNDRKDKFNLYLSRLRNSFQKSEHVSQTHKVDVRGKQGDGAITIVFENTANQLENHEAEQLKETGKTLVSEERFDEARAKFNEASLKANEEETRRSILACLNNLENEMNKKAMVIHNEGGQMLNDDNYDDALEKFEEALKFAKRYSTISLISNDIENVMERKRDEERSEECMREAERCMSGDQYEESLQKLNRALTFAKKRNTISVILQKIDDAQRLKISEENSLGVLRRAERCLSNDQYEEALQEFEEALRFARTSETIDVVRRKIAVIIEKKTNQENCEKIITEAEALLNKDEYQKALKEFEKASNLAEKAETINFIIKKHDEIQNIIKSEEKCHKLNQQAQGLLKRHNYDEALKILSSALKIAKTTQTLTLINNHITKAVKLRSDQENSERLNQEAETLMKDHQYEEALKKLAQASKLAQESETKELIKQNDARARQEKKNRDEAAALNQKGEKLLSEAFIIEGSSQDKSEEATRKFEAARDLFTRAKNLCSEDAYEGNCKLVNAKIKGNKCYNVAIRLETDAMQLKNKMETLSDRNEVVAKYKKAKTNYEMALKRFKEGMKIDEGKLQMGVQLAMDGVSGVSEILNKLEENILDYAIDCTDVKTLNRMESTIEEDSEITRRNCHVRVI